MKKFNLEDAKAGKKVVTRDGRAVEILKYDFRTGNHPILAVLDNDGKSQTVQNYTIDGCYYDNDTDSSYDLFMASTMISGWINIYQDMGKIITGVARLSSANPGQRSQRVRCFPQLGNPPRNYHYLPQAGFIGKVRIPDKNCVGA